MMTYERTTVNKKHGLKKFGEVGSLVVDEDLSLLGEKGEDMRKLYVDEGIM